MPPAVRADALLRPQTALELDVRLQLADDPFGLNF